MMEDVNSDQKKTVSQNVVRSLKICEIRTCACTYMFECMYSAYCMYVAT